MTTEPDLFEDLLARLNGIRPAAAGRVEAPTPPAEKALSADMVSHALARRALAWAEVPKPVLERILAEMRTGGQRGGARALFRRFDVGVSAMSRLNSGQASTGGHFRYRLSTPTPPGSAHPARTLVAGP